MNKQVVASGIIGKFSTEWKIIEFKYTTCTNYELFIEDKKWCIADSVVSALEFLVNNFKEW